MFDYQNVGQTKFMQSAQQLLFMSELLTSDTCRVQWQMLKVEYNYAEPIGQEFRAEIVLGQKNFEAMCSDSALGMNIYVHIFLFATYPTQHNIPAIWLSRNRLWHKNVGNDYQY
jgi:hypothetical protein